MQQGSSVCLCARVVLSTLRLPRMVAHNYATTVLQKRNLSGEFKGNRLKSSHVVGTVVESCFQRGFRPSPATLPVPLEFQKPSLFPSVTMRDVLVEGNTNPSTVTVEVTEADALLAIKIAQKVSCDLTQLDTRDVTIYCLCSRVQASNKRYYAMIGRGFP